MIVSHLFSRLDIVTSISIHFSSVFFLFFSSSSSISLFNSIYPRRSSMRRNEICMNHQSLKTKKINVVGYFWLCVWRYLFLSLSWGASDIHAVWRRWKCQWCICLIRQRIFNFEMMWQQEGERKIIETNGFPTNENQASAWKKKKKKTSGWTTSQMQEQEVMCWAWQVKALHVWFFFSMSNPNWLDISRDMTEHCTNFFVIVFVAVSSCRSSHVRTNLRQRTI